MMTVKQKDIEYFIEDFERNSTVELVEGQEKSELETIAEARGMKIKGSRDLGMIKTIYAFTNRPNDNGAILPQNELLKILPQIIGKPMTYNHERRYVIGHYIDYRYIQSTKTIIAYAVFYKSHFKPEWKEAKKLFKRNKLSSSFEIWNSKKLRKYFADGTFEMKNMEIAGGALVFQDKKNQPAFEGSDVLVMATKNTSDQPELVFAQKYKEEEIVGSNQWKKSIEENKQKLEAEKQAQVETQIEEVASTPEVPKEEVETPEKTIEQVSDAPQAPQEEVVAPIVPTVPKVTCSNCSEEFETIEVTNIKCPKCLAIINQTGEMLYPPQVKDFRMECPNCSMGDWLITKNDGDSSEIRCKSCAKNYVISFAQEKKSEMLDKIKFLYVGRARCPQCSNYSEVSGASDYNQRELTCKKCGLLYNIDTHKVENNRTIKSIVEESLEERREREVKELEIKQAEEKEVQDQETATPIEEEPTVTEDNIEVQVIPEEPKAEVITKSSTDFDGTSDFVELEIAEIPKTKSDSDETPQEASSEDAIDKPNEEDSLEESTEDEGTTGDNTPEESTQTTDDDKDLDDAKGNKIKKLYTALRKAVAKIAELKKAIKLETASITAEASKLKDLEIAKIIKQADEKIEFYKDNATLIVARREELGDYSLDIEDKDIVNDDVFTKVKLERENAILRAQAEGGTDSVGEKSLGRDEKFYQNIRNEIDNKAFKHSE